MLRTPVFKCLHMGAAALLVLAFTISAAGAQPAQAANATQISAGWMPFAGSLPDSHINLSGLVHIVARWQSVSSSETQVDIDVNLPAAGVTVTTDSGVPYSAFGGGQSSILFPTDPVFPNDPVRLVVPSFLLVTVGSDRPLPPNPILPPNPVLPPNPIKPYGFGLQFDLVFSAAGVLISMTAACRSSNSPMWAKIDSRVPRAIRWSRYAPLRTLRPAQCDAFEATRPPEIARNL